MQLKVFIQSVKAVNSTATIVIKSTIPVGYTQNISERLGHSNIIFAPEFLRESQALYDNLYPSRIIIGYNQSISSLAERGATFAQLLQEGAIKGGNTCFV